MSGNITHSDETVEEEEQLFDEATEVDDEGNKFDESLFEPIDADDIDVEL